MLHIVIGPPCAGKSTYVSEHAEAGDVTVDFDRLAKALGADSEHMYDGWPRQAAFRARQGAIDWLVENAAEANGWVIHSKPSARQRGLYESCGAEFVELDPGMEECLARAERDGRPQGTVDAIREWYESAKGAHMETKSGKAVEFPGGGSVVGYASTFDRIPDSYGDIIAPGAFAETLKAWEAKRAEGIYIPLLYGHSTEDPAYNIGRVVEAREDERGLRVVAEFDPDNEKAQYVRKLVQEGRLYQFSFAFAIKAWGRDEIDGQEVRRLDELELFEVSLVQIPANQNAVVVDVKSDAAEAKSGRRNSARDQAAIDSIGALAAQISEIVAGLTPADEGETDASQEREAQAEGAKGQAAILEIYKQAIKENY